MAELLSAGALKLLSSSPEAVAGPGGECAPSAMAYFDLSRPISVYLGGGRSRPPGSIAAHELQRAPGAATAARAAGRTSAGTGEPTSGGSRLAAVALQQAVRRVRGATGLKVGSYLRCGSVDHASCSFLIPLKAGRLEKLAQHGRGAEGVLCDRSQHLLWQRESSRSLMR
eukprot:CAMPEP_0174751688 /NCGR_PEP_ID=MMETSP1094-20130205/100363_1 /TAXON_ID=156173 /ORGANISM="Chrysochromulina brevifilum, Strain UTEX LB 985" /LENGTH=169 /DNA_ID=CAMNT_0015957215 /DNA_START=173 /DNA_END=683 /DNA_ORIENTATION=-